VRARRADATLTSERLPATHTTNAGKRYMLVGAAVSAAAAHWRRHCDVRVLTAPNARVQREPVIRVRVTADREQVGSADRRRELRAPETNARAVPVLSH
jgi:hypothetical protein